MQIDYSDFTNYQGTSPVQNYQPQILTSYKSIDSLCGIVTLFNSWQMETAFSRLQDLINKSKENAPSIYLASLRLAGEVLAIYNDFDQARLIWQEILKTYPCDSQALTHLGIYDLAQNKKDTYLKLLSDYHPHLYIKLASLVKFIKKHLKANDLPRLSEGNSCEVIVIFGTSVNPDGTPSDKLLSRLQAGLDVKELYPMASFITSGGAVGSRYNESGVMADWLVENGVRPQRIYQDPLAKDTVGNAIGVGQIIKDKHLENICLVTSSSHLPRSFINLSLVLDDYECGIVTYSNPNDTSQVSQNEYQQTYINAMRSSGVFTLDDFKKSSS